MKAQAIFTLIVSLVLTQFLMGQNENKVAAALKELNNDTATYIKQQIVPQKDSYIGKSLDNLLKDLPKILRYANGDVPSNRFICPATTLYFSSYKLIMDKIAQKEFPLLLVITWATPLDNKELPGLGLPIFGGEWTQDAYNYYKNKIIGNIETIKYDFK